MKMNPSAARVKRPLPRLSVSGFLLLALLVMPLAAHAQGSSPFDSGMTAIQTLFTGTIAKVSSLIAIVIGGYLDSSLALVSKRMFEVEEVGTPANVIVVEMGESDDVVIIASIQIDLEAVRQGDSLVRSIVVTLYVGIIEEDLSPACEINPAAICVPEREKRQLVHSFHHFLPR